jgi:hypothetical protein
MERLEVLPYPLEAEAAVQLGAEAGRERLTEPQELPDRVLVVEVAEVQPLATTALVAQRLEVLVAAEVVVLVEELVGALPEMVVD